MTLWNVELLSVTDTLITHAEYTINCRKIKMAPESRKIILMEIIKNFSLKNNLFICKLWK